MIAAAILALRLLLLDGEADVRPVISGRIVDAQTGKAIAGALVSTDVETRAVSDAMGEFRIAADPEAWPKELTIASAGRATASIKLPSARKTTLLGTIELTSGATIEIAIEGAAGKVRELDLLAVENRGRTRGRVVQTITASRFENVTAGDYVVIARGTRSWERIGVPVSVNGGEQKKIDLKIEPFTLRVRIEDGDARVANRKIAMHHRELHWEGELETDEHGEAEVELWQGGPLQCTVIAEGRLPYFARRDVLAGDEQWRIVLPNYELRGVVVDAESGKPIPDTALALRMKSEDGYTLAVDAKTDQNGAFSFSPVVYGSHTLAAGAAGYPPAEMPIQFRAPDVHRDVTLKLTRGKGVRITVVDERQRPLSGALVIVYAGLGEEGRAITDPAGSTEIVVTSPRTLYVIPRDGSFAIAAVKPDDRQKRIVVPEGVGRIELRARGENTDPIPNVSVVTRYNGTVLPLAIIDTLAPMHGWRPRADDAGRIVYTHVPAGTYEFWPVGSNAEFLALSAGVGPRAPVTMAVGPGENVAVLSFKRAR